MVVQTIYPDAPDRGYPGMILHSSSCQTKNAVAQSDLNVGIAVVKGDDIPQTGGGESFGYKVRLPAATSEPFVGLTVRIAQLVSDIPNSPDSVPIYETGDIVSFMAWGTMYVKAAKAIPAARNPVYFVHTDTNYPFGTLLPDDDTGNADLIPGAYFDRITPIDKIVLVTIPNN